MPSKPRVRFAPSPTGFLHLGSFRTVLFNYLFARQNGGAFILRIDDTDTARSKKEYEEDFTQNFSWLGLAYDEFYRQSERTQLYRDALKKLVEQGAAYPCYCTKEELQAQKDNQAATGQPVRYAGYCRNLSDEKKKKYAEEGRSPVYRLVVPDETVTIKDIIRGEVSFDLRLVGDFVIAKSMDAPLYNFASVVDDALMGITHIIRGDDILSNTSKHVILFRYLNAALPKFAHIPMVVKADKSKISKRRGDNPVHDYRKLGYLPQAIVNYAALLGWHPKDDREFFTLQELIREFSLERVQKSPAALDEEKLTWFNRQYMLKMQPQELLAAALSYLGDFVAQKGNAYVIKKTGEEMSQTALLKIIDLSKDRARHLADIKDTAAFFFEKELAYEPELLIWRQRTKDEIREYLEKTKGILMAIPDREFTAERVKQQVPLLSPNDVGLVLWPLRVALSGKKFSPPPFDIAEIFGKEKTLRYVDAAIRKLS